MEGSFGGRGVTSHRPPPLSRPWSVRSSRVARRVGRATGPCPIPGVIRNEKRPRWGENTTSFDRVSNPNSDRSTAGEASPAVEGVRGPQGGRRQGGGAHGEEGGGGLTLEHQGCRSEERQPPGHQGQGCTPCSLFPKPPPSKGGPVRGTDRGKGIGCPTAIELL